MIRLSSALYETLLTYARAALPDEACGLLAGSEEDGVRTICRVYSLTNMDASQSHFSMDPREQLAAVKDMRTRGLTPLGNWHSHPDTPSRPSEEDVHLAHDSNASYLILSLQSKKTPNLNAFRIQNGVYQWDILELYD
jgi:proteasome lid subunit RPN8/RPN11